MSRKTSIIISITCITIITLILMSLTYGFYNLKIIDNENSKSILVTTGDSSVLFSDLSISTYSAVIEPGYETVKLFTVKNTGKSDAIYSIYLDEVQNTFVRTNDITYTLYRKAGNNTIDLEKLDECEIINEDVFPKSNAYLKTDEVLKNTNDYYTYALKISYENSIENQNVDQGHVFGGKVQIHGSIENKFDEGTLAHKIINNSTYTSGNTTNNTKFKVPPLTKPLKEGSLNEENLLSSTNDDYGISYYFRGNVTNNYINYSGMCWRIVRIEGDGSIKLLLEDSVNECINSNNINSLIDVGNYGYKIDNSVMISDYINSTNGVRSKLNNWLLTSSKFSNETRGNLKNDSWCIGNMTDAYNSSGIVFGNVTNNLLNRESFYYNKGNNFFNKNLVTINCYKSDADGEQDLNNIGLLSMDEVAFAGGSKTSSLNYLNLVNDSKWWTISLSGFYSDLNSDKAFTVSNDGVINDQLITDNDVSIRPSITLISNIMYLDGDGSKSDPYIVE